MLHVFEPNAKFMLRPKCTDNSMIGLDAEGVSKGQHKLLRIHGAEFVHSSMQKSKASHTIAIPLNLKLPCLLRDVVALFWPRSNTLEVALSSAPTLVTFQVT